MAINPNTQYPGRMTAPDADYPYGSSKNESTPGAGDGSPYEKARANDIFGFQQALLIEAAIVPSGNADKVGASQYLQALNKSSGLVKDDYAALRLVESSQLSDKTQCFITDDTGGPFVLDEADVISTDNRGTIIVDADGGRWKRNGVSAFRGVAVEWFEAKGDGSTDDITSIQDAVDYMESIGGGNVYFAAKTYMKSADIAMKEYVYLRGAGQFKSILKNTAANIHGITFPALSSKYSGISDLAFTGHASDTTNAAIYFDPSFAFGYFKAENIRTSLFNVGIDIHDSTWISQFINIRIDNPIGFGVHGGGTGGTALGNIFDAVYVNNVAAGGVSFYFVNSLTRTLFSNCVVGATVSTETQFRLTNARGTVINTINFENMEIKAGEGLMRFESDTTVIVNGAVFQSVIGPTTGTGYLIRALGNAKVDVKGSFEYSDTLNNINTITVEDNAVVSHDGSNNWFSPMDSAGTPATAQLNQVSGINYVRSIEVDLSGAAVTSMIANVPNRRGHLISAKIIYTEATSSDAGILIEIGYEGDTNFLASITTSVSQAIWDTEDMTINDARVGGWSGPILITSPGGKTGTGKIIVELEYTTSE